MKIELWCNVHRAPVIPGRDSDSLYWRPLHDGEFELSYDALECTGGKGDHEFVVTITAETESGKTVIGEGGISNKDDGTCWCCGGLEGTHVVRSCVGQTFEKRAEGPPLVGMPRDYVPGIEL